MTTKSSANNRITKSLISKLEANPHIEGISLELGLLEKILTQAINDYYNTDKPLLTDATFDILENILREKKPNSKVFDKVGAPVVNPEDAVKLPYYLGSLDKVKPNEKSLTKWLAKHNKQIVISEKLDGLSCLFIMSSGTNSTSGTSRTDFQMKLYKHGDGFEGQDISHLLDNIAISSNNRLDKKEIIKMIENPLNQDGHIALRGEIIIKNEVYNAKYNKMYPKARSLIAGIVNSKTPDVKIVRDMEIIFYEFIYPSSMTFQQQFETIHKLGFNVARNKIYQNITENQLPEILMNFKKASAYEIDGIVLDDSSAIFKRATKENPEYAVAFKMQLEDQIATTTVVNVEYNISKHGTLAPRIEYKPVMIKGDSHQYTTGFNLKYIVDNNIGIGTELKIIKSGDVIPYIYEIIKSSKQPQMPSETIKWHWNETRVDGIVDDIENNNDVRVQKIIAFFKVMKIDGIGEGVVNKFVNAGYDEVKTILELTPDVITQVEGFQLKSATNVYNAFHKVIDKPQPLERVMTASGVFTIGLGEKKFKMILDAIPKFFNKWQQGKITKADILGISGFSDKTADIFIIGMPKFIEWLTIHSMIKIEIEDVASKDIPKGNKFAGIVAVFTGVRNADMEKQIIDGGGAIGSSISGKTTIVIAKDPNEGSSKLNKAREMGIEIVSITEFEKKYISL
jgi:DNA ligase (NAD+)